MARGGWFVGGGVAHSASDARRMLYAATGGGEGVGGETAFKVVPLDTPGAGFRVLPGTAMVASRFASDEMYQAVADVAETFTNPAATTARSDMVILRVEDPWANNSPWPPEGITTLDDVLKIRVLSNVPATARTLADVPGQQDTTGLPLARIDYPASTGTITDGMITDLRWLPGAAPTAPPSGGAGVASAAISKNYPMPAGATGNEGEQITVTGAAGQVWPAAAPATWGDVQIPAAATHANVLVVCSSTFSDTGSSSSKKSSWGEIWVALGTAESARLGWDTPEGVGPQRLPIIITKEMAIPQALRGTKQQLKVMARLLGSAAGGAAPAILDSRSEVSVRVEFFTKAG